MLTPNIVQVKLLLSKQENLETNSEAWYYVKTQFTCSWFLLLLRRAASTGRRLFIKSKIPLIFRVKAIVASQSWRAYTCGLYSDKVWAIELLNSFIKESNQNIGTWKRQLQGKLIKLLILQFEMERKVLYKAAQIYQPCQHPSGRLIT